MADQSARTKLAAVLKECREAKHMTVYEAGEAVGKSGKTVSAWENGRGQPDAEMLLKLCDLYEVESISVFFGETPKGMSTDEYDLIQLFRDLNDEGRDSVLNCARGLVASGAYKKSDPLSMGEEDAQPDNQSLIG